MHAEPALRGRHQRRDWVGDVHTDCESPLRTTPGRDKWKGSVTVYVFFPDYLLGPTSLQIKKIPPPGFLNKTHLWSIIKLSLRSPLGMWDNTHFPAHSGQQTDTAYYLWLYRRLPIPPGQHQLLQLSCNSAHDPKEAIKPFQKASLRHNPRHWAIKWSWCGGGVQVQELYFSLHLLFRLCLSRTVSVYTVMWGIKGWSGAWN